jgi:hypothetical protein
MYIPGLHSIQPTYIPGLHSIQPTYIPGLHSIQPTYIRRLFLHNMCLYVLEGFFIIKKYFFFPNKKFCASQAFLNSSGSLLIVFGWVKDLVYLSLCKEPLLFLYFLLFALKV